MRFLHTSDWHLGRSFHRESLVEAQRAFLDHLVATAVAREVDAVLVAGDVYDRALPGLESVALLDDALRRLAGAGVPVVLTSGNHDSARRLGFGGELLSASGVHLRTDPVSACTDPVLFEDAHGPVAVYGLPYLEPALVRAALDAEKPGHESVLGAALDRVRADLAARPAGTRSIVLAHAFVTGGEPSDSERDITVGGVQSVPAGLFHGIDYTALGHLHGCQTLGERVRYSGSPLAYSFSEAAHRKTMWLVELGAGGALNTERIPCPVPRRLALLRGRLDELLADDEAAERHGADWLQVTLTDAGRPHNPMERLRARFPHTLQLAFEPESAPDAAPGGYARRVTGRSDLEIGTGFVEHVRGSAASRSERALLREAFEAVRIGADASDAERGVR